jgi:predicted AAA+ superfamily ATPase
MEKLDQLRDANLIKVVSGIRRSGKSIILQMFRQKLVNSGVDLARTQFINFEDPDYNSSDSWRDIYDKIKAKLSPNKKNYIFLDEIQNISGFEKLADGLFVNPDVDLYITGSNAYFLSSELATLLTGRYIEIKVLPLSFAEYYEYFREDTTLDRNGKFDQYIRYGAFPEVANFLKNGIDAQIPDYLSSVFNTIIRKDIIPRYNFRSYPIFESVIKFAFDSVGSLVSSNSIKNSLNAASDEKIGVERVDHYLEALMSGFILYRAERYDIKGKKLLRTLNKYYPVDTGLRYVLLGRDISGDKGHILENIVYLELLRRGNQVWVGKANEKKEVDFIVRTPQGYTEYFQVADTIIDEATRTRELEPLYAVNDHNAKYIITRDPGEWSHNGIRQIKVVDWLLS